MICPSRDEFYILAKQRERRSVRPSVNGPFRFPLEPAGYYVIVGKNFKAHLEYMISAQRMIIALTCAVRSQWECLTCSIRERLQLYSQER